MINQPLTVSFLQSSFHFALGILFSQILTLIIVLLAHCQSQLKLYQAMLKIHF